METKKEEQEETSEPVIEALNRMDDEAFRSLVSKLMQSMGLQIIKSDFAGKSARILAEIGESIKSADYSSYLIRMDRKEVSVTPEDVQEFVYEKDLRQPSGLIYMTTSSFSEDAKTYAREFDVEVADHTALAGLLIKFNLIEDVMIYKEQEISKEERGRFLPSVDILESVMEEGMSAYARGDLKEAYAHFFKASDMKPNYEDGWYMRGLVLNELEDYEEALSSFMQALDINIENPNSWFALGETLFHLGRHREELECYDKALELQKDFLAALNNKGATLLYLEKYEDAVKTYDEILHIDPNYTLAWNNKGIAQKKLKMDDEALECFINAIKIDSRYYDAWMNRGLIYLKNKRYKNAYHSFQAALAVRADDVQALYHKAKTLEGIAQYSAALEIYDRILILDPKFVPAKRRITKVKEYIKRRKERPPDEDFFKLTPQESKEFAVAPPEKERILIERKVSGPAQTQMEERNISAPKAQPKIEPPEAPFKEETAVEATVHHEEQLKATSLTPTSLDSQEVDREKLMVKDEEILKARSELKTKEKGLLQMEEDIRKRYSLIEDERNQLENLQTSLGSQKEEMDKERFRLENQSLDMKLREKELVRLEEDLLETKTRLKREQEDLERERDELKLKANKIDKMAYGGVEDRIALEREHVKMEQREKEIDASTKKLLADRNNIENTRLSLQRDMEKIITAKAELGAREKSLNQRESEMKKRFDDIVNKSGSIAIKEKELEEMARELRRTQEMLEKKAKILVESEKMLLEKQRLLAENRARMKDTVRGVQKHPPQKEVFGEFGREVVTPQRKKRQDLERIAGLSGPQDTAYDPSMLKRKVPYTSVDDLANDRELLEEIDSLKNILILYGLNRFDLSLKKIKEAQEAQLDSRLLWNIFGNIMLKKGELEEANECYSNALRRDQSFVITLVNMMSLYQKTMKLSEAKDICNKILMLRPQDEKFMVFKAILEAQQGLFDEAHTTLDNLLLDNDKMDTAWNLKALLLYNTEQNDEALECCEAVLSRNPLNVPALNTKGVILFDKGDYDGAVHCFQKANRLGTNSMAARNLKAAIERKKQPKEPGEEIQKETTSPKGEVKESVADIISELGKVTKESIEDSEDMDRIIEEMEETAEALGKKEDSADLYMCPSCGSFVSSSASKCEKCGYDFEEEILGNVQSGEGEFALEDNNLVKDKDDTSEETEGRRTIEGVEEEKGKDLPPLEETIQKFLQISGVGRTKAQALYEAGFTSYDSLRKKSISELADVKGIGNSLAKDIKNQLKKKKFRDVQ